MSLPPETKKHGDLFMQSKCRPTPKCWYIDMGVGINTIRQTVNELWQLAGTSGGNFHNQSYRSTSATHLVRGNQDNKVVKAISGHRSDVVDRYKHINNEQKRKASAILQNHDKDVTEVKPCSDNVLLMVRHQLTKKWKTSCHPKS